MNEFIPYGRQLIDDDDIAAVADVLKSDFLTQGPVVPLFEQAISAVCGATHCVAVSNATSALHLACKALGVGPGDVVWTSPITFVASANAALYCGAKVDFVDIDKHSYNMSPRALDLKLKHAAAVGKLPKVIIPVHLAGQACEMEAIHQLATRYGVRIIEDASHAIGGEYQSHPIGDGRYSDITVFSFHPVKIVTTGEGGAAVTNDRDLAEAMRTCRSHGITRDPDMLHDADVGPWYYEQQQLGFNYRMTDIAAALGVSQLEKLPQFIARRRQIAQEYDSALADLPIKKPRQIPDAASAWHLYIIRLDGEDKRQRHRAVFEHMRRSGIGVNLHYIPVYLQPYYQDLGFESGLCPNAEAYYSEAISLPISPSLTADQQRRVIDVLREAVV